jgi:MFS family permease
MDQPTLRHRAQGDIVRAAIVWVGLFLGITLLQIGNGLQSTVVGLRTVTAGFDPVEIALVMSGFYFGYAFGALGAVRMISLAGHIWVFIALVIVASLAALIYPFMIVPLVWAGIRVVIGFALSAIYVTVESWINDQTGNESRGGVFGFYMLGQLVGLAIGQALVPFFSATSVEVFLVVGSLMALSIVPVVLVRPPAASREPPKPMGLISLFRVSPLGVAACLVSGFVWAAIMGGGPVYAAKSHFSPEDTATFIAAAVIGGMILQYPLGWLSDKLDRRVVLGLLVLAAAMAALTGVGASLFGPFGATVTIALFGGLSFPLYTIAVAHTNDHVEPDERVSASAGLVLLFGIGSVFGPAAVSFVIEQYGGVGFFLLLAGANAVLFVFAILRMIVNPRGRPRTVEN